MYRNLNFKRRVFLLLAIIISYAGSAQTAYNVIKWGGTLTANPTTFSAGSLAGLTDGGYSDLNTITITGSTASNRWMQYQCSSSVLLSSYSITSYSSYRPTAWTFSGSNDGNIWTTLDTRTAQTFTNYVANNYVLTGVTTPYSYYKVSFTTTYSTSSLSICEFELFTTSSVPAAPILNGNALSGTEAGFSWNYSLTQATDSFYLERSLNGINYVLVKPVAGSLSAYLDQTLSPSTLFYYRLRAKDAYGFSSYSNVVQLTTGNLSGQSADITDDGGKLYVSAENSGGASAAEGSPKFIDNDITTKWLVFTTQASGNLSAVYKPTGSYIVTSYVLSTANDSPPRDPKSWGFYGSNDSISWIKLDSQMNQLGNNAARSASFSYVLPNPGNTAYKFYRILFTANNGATDGVRFQIAEWQILGIDANSPSIPTSLAVANVTSSSISLTWAEAATKPVSTFRLQRCEDGINFKTVATLPASATGYIDQKVYDSTVYYYRLQALGSSSTAVSGWSNVATAQTTFIAGLPLDPRDMKVVFAIDSVVGLSWTDRSYNETGFRVQRSTDGNVFTDIQSLSANTIAVNDSTVWPAIKYYYRVVAFNAQGVSGYSNIDSVLTTGYNHPPLIAVPPIDRNICSNSASYTFSISGLTPGASNEAMQSLTVTNVTVDKPQLFSNITFVPQVTNGVATFTVTGNGTALNGDVTTVSIKIKDNGGITNVGKDSSTFSFKLIFIPLSVTITADRDTMHIPRYVTVHLSAATNYPSSTPNYSWDAAEGIVSDRGGIVLNVEPIRQTAYTVHATSVFGCTASAQITLVPVADHMISNVLTPNGDGINDKWIVWNIEKNANNSVKVFDRAGRLVFFKNNYANDWDGSYKGRILDEGMYYYVIDYGDGSKPVTGTLNILKEHK